MTNVADMMPPARSDRRWPTIALLLSLALNLCFVAGPLLWHRFGPSPGQRVLAHVVRQLELTTQQRQAFEDFARTVRRHGRQMHDTNEPLRQAIWSEEIKNVPDAAHLAVLVGQADANRRQFQQAAADALLTFTATLTPRQRAEFAQMIGSDKGPAADRLWHALIP